MNAKSQYGPYTDFDIAVAAIASPTGPRVAGQHGIGLLSIGATTTDGFDLLAHHWDVMEERAAQYGKVADRNQWRLVGPMHIAETKEQAIEDVPIRARCVVPLHAEGVGGAALPGCR